MKTNREIRAEARKVLKGGWFWRVVTVVIVLQLFCQLVAYVIDDFYKTNEIPTWTAFAQSKFEALQSGLDYCVPSTEAALRMSGAGMFEMFILYIFSAILAYGIAVVTVKAAKNDRGAWFSPSMGGFKSPLGLAWFLFVMNLRVFLWTILFIIPGIVAIYRYRLAWYIRAENPEKSVSDCLRESSNRMKGFKGQAFELDASFIGWFLLLGIGFAFALVYPVVSIIPSIGLIYLLVYFFTARAVFYNEVCHSVSRAA